MKQKPDHYVLDDGSERWELDNKLHRDDGPALIMPEGKSWYRHGVLHREGGPAVEMAHGTKKWFVNGEYHREDGPALDTGNPETSRWYIHGRQLEPEEVAERVAAIEAAQCRRESAKVERAMNVGLRKAIKTMKPLRFG